jgi:hypothetical protein
MTNYFSKLARMSGLPVGGTSSAAQGIVADFALDQIPSEASPLHVEEVLNAEPQAIARTPTEAGPENLPQTKRAVDSGLAQTDSEAYPSTAQPLDLTSVEMPIGLISTWPTQSDFAAPQTIEFKADPISETGLAALSMPSAITGTDSLSQAISPLPTTERKYVLPSVNLNPIEEEQRRYADPEAAPSANPGLTVDKTAQDLDLNVNVSREAKAPPEVPTERQPRALENRYNIPDPHADLWREINGWISAQPEPEEAQAMPRQAESSQRREPIQDFSLSIGNISIIVEEPPKPSATSLPSPAPSPSRPACADGFFRLDRHYL